MNIKEEVLTAEKRIRRYIRKTPLEYSPYLSELSESNVYLKLENLQLTGSFKARGAMNKVTSLTKKQRERGVITASTGNHALGVASALKILNCEGTIYLPENSSRSKLSALEYYPINLEFYGNDCSDTEVHARRIAEENDQAYISPYNDREIIGGQGTIGVELSGQLENIDSVLVAVGGGGLISGIAGYLSSADKGTEFIGCLPENSPVMYESVKAGKIIDMEIKPTISDGTAGGIEHGSITFDLCKRLVDDYILVNEKEIKEAIRLVLKKHHLVIEGAAGVTVGSFLKEKERFRNKDVVLVICGGNISLDKLKGILCD
ncbi:MAG: threonine/serine dehydratase [Euryarchaeota archaeon]|nr:threonine/serine dehydratase [Euryarchaeota archaeon]